MRKAKVMEQQQHLVGKNFNIDFYDTYLEREQRCAMNILSATDEFTQDLNSTQCDELSSVTQVNNVHKEKKSIYPV